ncbi:hypothetical protein EVAR_39907_1 [Eumeta japonica]|uniref:Uncharacterized protein n=1 Tax=Eumeta variegata TaxID=151549 RepID=A0A4C1WM12_EUMVA|nr:hypothetical protein EVAR_39907_1 [Eumeta japonica]
MGENCLAIEFIGCEWASIALYTAERGFIRPPKGTRRLVRTSMYDLRLRFCLQTLGRILRDSLEAKRNPRLCLRCRLTSGAERARRGRVAGADRLMRDFLINSSPLAFAHAQRGARSACRLFVNGSEGTGGCRFTTGGRFRIDGLRPECAGALAAGAADDRRHRCEDNALE